MATHSRRALAPSETFRGGSGCRAGRGRGPPRARGRPRTSIMAASQAIAGGDIAAGQSEQGKCSEKKHGIEHLRTLRIGAFAMQPTRVNGLCGSSAPHINGAQQAQAWSIRSRLMLPACAQWPASLVVGVSVLARPRRFIRRTTSDAPGQESLPSPDGCEAASTEARVRYVSPSTPSTAPRRRRPPRPCRFRRRRGRSPRRGWRRLGRH